MKKIYQLLPVSVFLLACISYPLISSAISVGPLEEICLPTMPGCPGYIAPPPVLIPQTITFDSISDTDINNENVALTATSTSGLPITFIVATGTCMIGDSGVNINTPGLCSVIASQSGNEIYLPATSVTNSFFVADGNGVRPSVENSAPNGGDGNGDGIKDSLQSNVVSTPDYNLQESSYVTLQVDGDIGPTQITNFRTSSKKGLVVADGSVLPVGGFSFTARGGFEGFIRVKIILDKVYDTTGWVLKKNDGESGNLVTGPEATFTTVNIGGIPKTEIVYSIRDNEEFDQNGDLGIITDPVFPIAPLAPIPAPAPVTGGGSIVVPAASYSYGTGNLFPSAGQVLGTSTSVYTNTCKIYMDPNDAIIPGGKNNPKSEVILLQNFLNKNLQKSIKDSIPVNGFYGKETYEAVRTFQLKYKKEILSPWGITEPTLNTYYTTVHQINILSCPLVTGPIDNGKLIVLSKLK